MPGIDAELSREHFFEELKRSPRAVLLLDYDGTLAPYHRDPAKALPYPGLPALLREIMRTGNTRVVLVSGRRAQDLVVLLGIFPPPEIWGAHGLQRLQPDGDHKVLSPDGAVVQALRDAAAWLQTAGLRRLAEFKQGSIAVTWRGLSPQQAARVENNVRNGWEPIARRPGVVLLQFDGGLELRMSGRDKGDVVRLLLQETGDHVPVAFLGNDAPDEQAFRALQGSGLSVLVSPAARETAANLRIRPPAELFQFLWQWLQARRQAWAYLCGSGPEVEP